MSDNWVVQNLTNALETWNDKLSEIWLLITQSPENFKGGAIWSVIVSIHGALQAIGYALLVVFFVVGVMKTCGSFAEIKKPEHAVKLFVRFALAKGLISYGMELMLALLNIVQGVISSIMNAAGFGGAQQTVLPQEIITAVEECGFFESIPLWAVTLIGGLFIWVLSFVMILSVYGRFFKMFMYTAIAPIPLSSFAGEPSQNIGKSFLKGYAAVCLEGAIIVLACIIFSVFAASPPVVDVDAAAASMVWSYIGELIFNMLILVGSIKMADRIVHEMMGLKGGKGIGSKNQTRDSELYRIHVLWIIYAAVRVYSAFRRCSNPAVLCPQTVCRHRNGFVDVYPGRCPVCCYGICDISRYDCRAVCMGMAAVRSAGTKSHSISAE